MKDLPLCSDHLCTYPGTIKYEGIVGAWCPRHDPLPKVRSGSVPPRKTGKTREQQPPVGMRGTITQCVYCGAELTTDTFTRDHVIPTSRGGAQMGANIAPACKDCNGDKGPLTASEYLSVRGNKIELKRLKTKIMKELNP